MGNGRLEDEASDSDFKDEDEGADEDDLFGTSFAYPSDSQLFNPRNDAFSKNDDSSESIVFEDSRRHSEDAGDSTASSAVAKTSNDEEKPNSEPETLPRRERGKIFEKSYMYIQMEYCDKQTLRSAIDSGLHENTDRVWKMFRVPETIHPFLKLFFGFISLVDCRRL